MKYQRILAYAIQRSNPNHAAEWNNISPQLKRLGVDESMLQGVKSALKVPQFIDRLVKDLNAILAAIVKLAEGIALSQTASIALLDHQINTEEYKVMQTLLDAIADNC